MPRFITNRWWTFILALVLGLGLTLASATHHDAYAAKLGNGITGSGDGQGGGLPPPGNGDPDVPIGSSVRTSAKGAALRPQTVFTSRAAGDSRVLDSALMLRLQIVMRALKGFYFHI